MTAADKPERMLPKPDRVEVGQWWSFDGASPGRIARRYTQSGYPWAAFEPGGPNGAKTTTMLLSPRWAHLGNGERPDIGGSEVAGEERR